jgi:ABC-type polysaccharide/polyol phosphate transport system ATPase subunit
MIALAIQASGISKRYRRGMAATSGLLRDSLALAFRSPLKFLRREKSEAFWALQDVSLEVREGEVLGLIGRNGSGKTTLLKILSRITRPTAGWAEIRGHVGSLLEVGTGFHPELTGRENTYLSGAILGMRKQDITHKFDEIVAFAELEKFIDTPVKHYSSGMYVRLAFAVAAHLEPEILLVDEVLAVGDMNFQKKCLGKMGDVARAGRTVVLVSHQLNQIRRLCQRVIWLDSGLVRQVGPTPKVVGAYESTMGGSDWKPSDRSGRQCNTRFLKWELEATKSETPHTLNSFGPVGVHFYVRVSEAVRRGIYGIALFNAEREVMWAGACHDLSLEPGIHLLSHRFPSLPLRPGVYSWQVSLWREAELLDLWDALPELNIDTEAYQHPMDQWSGVLNIPAEFDHTEERDFEVAPDSRF